MPNKPTYNELLKHPLWQRKRLEILQRAAFSCEDCGERNRTLHVHHTYYEKGFKPWEYPDKSYCCLCDQCHEQAQDVMKELQRRIGKTTLADMELLIGYAMGLEAHADREAVLDVFTYGVAEGLAAAWDLNAELIIESLSEGKIDGAKLYFLWEQGRRRV